MAYVRTKTIKGDTYRYLVKSVREGKRVRQVFVSYIGNPPTASSRAPQEAASNATEHQTAPWGDFIPLTGSDLRVPYAALLRQLGCQSVRFNLRAKHKHGETHAQRHVETGEVVITNVCLPREASAHAMAHEVGHGMDYLLLHAQDMGGSLNADFLSHTGSLRKLADYTCVHHETSSPDYVRQLQTKPVTPVRQRHLRRLKRYYETYVYQADELFARLVAVSFTEPGKAKAIAPAAYAWVQETLYQNERICCALAEVDLWPISR